LLAALDDLVVLSVARITPRGGQVSCDSLLYTIPPPSRKESCNNQIRSSGSIFRAETWTHDLRNL